MDRSMNIALVGTHRLSLAQTSHELCPAVDPQPGQFSEGAPKDVITGVAMILTPLGHQLTLIESGQHLLEIVGVVIVSSLGVMDTEPSSVSTHRIPAA